MEIRTTLAADDLREIIARVSSEAYGGNLAGTVDRLRGCRRPGAAAYRVKLAVRTSRGPGARRSGSGRRGSWACWHAFRDVLALTYVMDPGAHVVTALARYGDAAGFCDRFPSTGDRNIGSMVDWCALADACECEADDGRDDVARGLPDYADALDDVVRGIRTRPEVLVRLAQAALDAGPGAVGARAARHGR